MGPDAEQRKVEDFEHLLESKIACLDEKLDKVALQVSECLSVLAAKSPGCVHVAPRSSNALDISAIEMVLPPPPTRLMSSMGSRPSRQSETYFASGRVSEAALTGTTSQQIAQASVLTAHNNNSNNSPPTCQSSASRTSGQSDGYRRASRASVESIASWIMQRRRNQGHLAQCIWNFLDNPDSSAAASVYNRTMPAFILLTVLFGLIQATQPALALGGSEAAEYVDIAIETAFALEIGTRFLVCPNRLTFFASSYNVIDVASAIPLAVRVGLEVAGTPRRSRGVRLVLDGFVPVLRLLKTLRRFQTLHLLTKAFRLASEAVPVLLYFYLCVWLLFSAIVYAVEDRGNLASFSDAMWLTFVSMTTVGYGDYSPKSAAGRAAVAMLVLSCTLYMAIPIGIIGSCFSEVWSDRDRILLVQRLRSCFVQNGFTAEDIPEVFAGFDFDNTGTLNLLKFRRMAEMLRLGLSEARVVALFQLLDDDGSGAIDDQEFVKTLFPGAYPMLYNAAGKRLSSRGGSRLINHLMTL